MMKLRAFIFVFMMLMLGGAEACKCMMGDTPMHVETRYCCVEVGGFPRGHDCPAGTISKHLSAFSDCCKSMERGFKSDCRCPKGC
ncbi:hypothetical protein VFPFJ_10898 [Purpureocillium lilacinum]|uniref:Uncharacterized protein n=1 Tax=Purpureocillium lilacinum TaxID=33203 RepID=A0A179GD17_PURLI|nr:hypothetical protein VFPFJ_10898 [Purpureocillium lilacinum]OAQ75060.1 hypothetical protein VFPFJ_10898 [Purpureocillium lilacinum]OAQ75717.1 hypothetical protein VFPBJ_09690 [Purpureocillium lilacinum]